MSVDGWPLRGGRQPLAFRLVKGLLSGGNRWPFALSKSSFHAVKDALLETYRLLLDNYR
ncbi:hypothetical protein HMPREF9135_0518 [Segatella baroniae F0067]|uniref:Uncharacterized protein n=1 Tax=Segatella baroniae F0067 TaxID=1115809 RepID=U2QFS0_9BACT|nr:hypothetical protein HMPREF9135_0518 [Segatella baroniae F0067]